MAKSNTDASTSEAFNNADAGGDGLPPQFQNGNNGATAPLEGEYNELIDQAKGWVKENQTMAMLGGFGFGVFIGVLLRR